MLTKSSIGKYAFAAFVMSFLLTILVTQAGSYASELWRQYLVGLKSTITNPGYEKKWPIAERYGLGVLSELEQNMKAGKKVGLTDSELHDFVFYGSEAIIDHRATESDKVSDEMRKWSDKRIEESMKLGKKSVKTLTLEAADTKQYSEQLQAIMRSADKDKVGKLEELNKWYKESNQLRQNELSPLMPSAAEDLKYSMKYRNSGTSPFDSKEIAAQTADLQANVDLSGRILRICQYYATNPANWYQSLALKDARNKYQYATWELDEWKKTSGTWSERYHQFSKESRSYLRSRRQQTQRALEEAKARLRTRDR